MSPDPKVVATWTSDDGTSKIALYDDGVMKVFAGELELEIVNPWKRSDEQKGED